MAGARMHRRSIIAAMPTLTPTRATRKAFLQIHFCVLLWGFTAILGKLITLPALPLVWWRMLLVVGGAGAGAARVARAARDAVAAALARMPASACWSRCTG